MENSQTIQKKMTNFRWVICAMLFLATTVNYMDRQVLSLTWKDFISPEFHWSDTDYGNITAMFSLVYAIANIFAGRFIDFLGTKKGYLWAIGIWSLGACLHAACGWATQSTLGISVTAEMIGATGQVASLIAMTSVYFFIAARIILAVGEAGNFPSAVKVTAEYFPQKDRAFSTSIFNAGSTVGALFAPVCIPALASYFRGIGVGNGWEMAFIIIGGLGFIWMGFWVFIYKDVRKNPHVNSLELAYILQDSEKKEEKPEEEAVAAPEEPKLTIWQILSTRQAWSIFLGKFTTDGVWWFILFWTPAFLSDVYGYTSDSTEGAWLIFMLYMITLLSIFGGKLPTWIIRRTGWDPYKSRMRAMLAFAVFPLVGLMAQPLGVVSCVLTVLLIGIMGAAHQSWSANFYSVGSDLFPRSAVATITGLGGLAGGLSSFLINKFSGMLFDYADATQMQVLGFTGKEAGYYIVFMYCSVAYLIGWILMKSLVPKYKKVTI